MTEVLRNVSMGDYLASDMISSHRLKTFIELGAFAYYARHLCGEDKIKVTPEMRFGQMVEDFIQRPAEFKTRYQEVDDVGDKEQLAAQCIAQGLLQDSGKPFSARCGVATMKLALLRAAGGDALTRGEAVTIERIAQNFDRNSQIKDVLAQANETQVTLRNDLGGIDVLPGIQCRPDWYSVALHVDLKCVGQFDRVDANAPDSHAFQAAFRDVVAGRPASHALIVAETVWPHRVQVVDVDDDTYAFCRDKVLRELERLREHYATDEWPLCDERRTMAAPRYVTAWRGQ